MINNKNYDIIYIYERKRLILLINLLELFALKMIDTIINSGKTIFMIRNKKFLSALSQAVSNVFYVILMSRLMKSTDFASICVTSLALFIGQYLSQWIAEKFDKDKIWRISITPPTKEIGKNLADELRDSNIAVQTYPCFFNEEKTLGINAFSENKASSAIVSSILSNYDNVKFNITQIKNRF